MVISNFSLMMALHITPKHILVYTQIKLSLDCNFVSFLSPYMTKTQNRDILSIKAVINNVNCDFSTTQHETNKDDAQ